MTQESIQPDEQDEDRILQTLLLRYFESVDMGRPAQLEELCSEHKELLTALRELVQESAADPGGTQRKGRLLGGRYRLLNMRGVGGMGMVFEAQDERLERLVAVKILEDLFQGDPERRERFRREGRTLARLENPHIVAVHDIDLDHSPPFLVMDLIEGFDLQIFLTELEERTKAFRLPEPAEASKLAAQLFGCEQTELAAVFSKPWPEFVARLGLQICTAVTEAHEHGILHRDIKPSNFMLDIGGRLRLLDFGIARNERDPSLTRASTSPGTPLYMSPQQVMGKGASKASDQYSIAATLYQCLVLQPPFAGSGRELENRILHDEPCPPRELIRQAPRELGAVIIKALHKSPKQRYASVAELREDLARFLRFEPVQAKGTVMPRILRRAVGTWRRYRPRPSYLAAGLLFLVALLYAGLWGGGRWAQATEENKVELRQLLRTLPPTLALAGTEENRLEHPNRKHYLAQLDRILELDADDVEARFLRLKMHEEAPPERGSSTSEDLEQLTVRLGGQRLALLNECIEIHKARRDQAPGVAAGRIVGILESLDTGSGTAEILRKRLLLIFSIDRAIPEKKRFLEADKYADDYERLAGQTALSEWSRGIIRMAIGTAAQKCLDFLETADRLCPDHASTLLNLARAYRRLGQLEDALKHVKRAQELGARNINYLEMHAHILRDMKRYDEAETIIASFTNGAKTAKQEQLWAVRQDLAQALLLINKSFHLVDGPDRKNLLLAAIQKLRPLIAANSRATRRFRRLAESNLRLAKALGRNRRVERLDQLLLLLKDDPLNPLLLVSAHIEARKIDWRQVSKGVTWNRIYWLWLEQAVAKTPQNVKTARDLVRFLLPGKAERALDILSRFFAPKALSKEDKQLFADALAALPSAEKRVFWRDRLQIEGFHLDLVSGQK